MSQAALSKRLAGRLPFTVDELGELATFLGVPIESFFVEARRAVPA
ncbi:Cro protein [Gordonia phage TillyBobJoe]|uniref:Cro protein n=2 Tax=Wizardvirus TaxID=2169658 RepID=A0A5P8DA52_9CAUD|nr:Cro protein [Gordonia phage TillyBobJoe]YP_010104265.1 Cro protein [Gordonia phage Fireball]AXQ62281.1 Cro protein [Gordonia phage TillyBobJoe]QFP95876.1 Cro protein [Gordonia phage Fireball]